MHQTRATGWSPKKQPQPATHTSGQKCVSSSSSSFLKGWAVLAGVEELRLGVCFWVCYDTFSSLLTWTLQMLCDADIPHSIKLLSEPRKMCVKATLPPSKSALTQRWVKFDCRLLRLKVFCHKIQDAKTPLFAWWKRSRLGLKVLNGACEGSTGGQELEFVNITWMCRYSGKKKMLTEIWKKKGSKRRWTLIFQRKAPKLKW